MFRLDLHIVMRRQCDVPLEINKGSVCVSGATCDLFHVLLLEYCGTFWGRTFKLLTPNLAMTRTAINAPVCRTLCLYKLLTHQNPTINMSVVGTIVDWNLNNLSLWNYRISISSHVECSPCRQGFHDLMAPGKRTIPIAGTRTSFKLFKYHYVVHIE